jgi:hypothetical protein
MTRTTMEQIRAKGLKALADELGPVGMIRFLQLFENGRGDYSKERHKLLTKCSVRDLATQIRRRRKSVSR